MTQYDQGTASRSARNILHSVRTHSLPDHSTVAFIKAHPFRLELQEILLHYIKDIDFTHWHLL